MKNSSLLSILILTTQLLQAQLQSPGKEQEIQQTVINLFQALSDRDSVALKKYCSPDITLYEYGQSWNLDTLIRKAIIQNQSADFKRINTFDFIKVESDKSMAWVTYRLTSVVMKEGKETVSEWLETVVLERKGRQWRVKHLHSTLVRRS